MNTYTPSALELVDVSLPQDAIDLRRVLTVNTPLQTLADGVLYAYGLDAITNNKINALPGVGTNYGASVIVPATSGVCSGTGHTWLPDTADGVMSGMVLQTANGQLVVPIQNMPLTGVVTGYRMLLKGCGVSTHSAMPEHPYYSELIRWDYVNGGVVVAATEIPAGQTYAEYDVLHVQTSNTVDHTISFVEAPNNWPATYYFRVYGEYGTDSVTGGAVYSFQIYTQGVSV